MKHWKCLAAGAAFGISLLAWTELGWAAEGQRPEPGKQVPQKLERNKITMGYLLYLPKDYAQKESWPLVLFLHGGAECGDNLDLVKRFGLPNLIATGKQFPFIVVSPQYPNSHTWEPHEMSLLLDEIAEKYKVDKDRVYVTGISMGGFGTWLLGACLPDRFAALVPICGGGNPGLAARRLAHVPVWVFHGAKDSLVPLERAKEMVDALRKAGGNVKFTIYPDRGHDAFLLPYNDSELYKWLLEQKRKHRETGGSNK